MRKFTLSAAAALLAMSAFMASCKKDADNKTSKEPLPVKTEKVNSNDTTGARASALAPYIRYVDTQRVTMEYSMAKEYAQADSLAQIQLAALQNSLSNSLNAKAQTIQDKAQRGGYINQSAYEADMASLQKAQQDAENRMAQRQRDYTMDLLAKQAQMHDSLQSVINDIVNQLQLDAVLTEQSGLYFNPSLDITDQVIAELNRRYQPKK